MEILSVGARVEKCNSVSGQDGHRDGAKATIQSVLGPTPNGLVGYFVHWDDLPGLDVFIAGDRVKEIDHGRRRG